VKEGDLVKVKNGDALAIVVDVYPDLCQDNPWVRVYKLNSGYSYSCHAAGYQWFKMNGLQEIKQKRA
jgi:hypothetical protein